MNRKLKFRSVNGCGIGIGAQMIKANVSAVVGIIRNSVFDDERGRIGSLVNSLIPSAIG